MHAQTKWSGKEDVEKHKFHGNRVINNEISLILLEKNAEKTQWLKKKNSSSVLLFRVPSLRTASPRDE
jgi:hypothetical protein